MQVCVSVLACGGIRTLAFTGDTHSARRQVHGRGVVKSSRASSAVMQHLLARTPSALEIPRGAVREGRKKCRPRRVCAPAAQVRANVCVHLNQPVCCGVAVFLPARTHAV